LDAFASSGKRLRAAAREARRIRVDVKAENTTDKMSETMTMMVDLYQVDPDVLAQAVEILKRRAKLIEEFESLFGSQPQTKKGVQPHTNGHTPRFRSGSTGEKVVRLLQQCGSEGMRVKEMAQKLKQKPQTLYTFFSSNKRIPGVKKVAPAHYVLTT
jgi:hypothetical protein